MKLYVTLATVALFTTGPILAFASEVPLTPQKFADGIANLTPDERLKAAAMIESINTCTADCTLLGIVSRGNFLYAKKVAAGMKDASLTPEAVSQGFSKLSPDQRLKVAALVEAARSCTGDCTNQKVMAAGAIIYNEKVDSGQSVASIGTWGSVESKEPESPVDPGSDSESVSATVPVAVTETRAQAPTLPPETKVEYHALGGAEYRGGSGGSIALGGDVTLITGDPKRGALSYTNTIQGDFGSTNQGYGVLPAAKIGFAVSGDAGTGWVGSRLNPVLEKADPMNMLELQKRWTLDVNVDRDLALRRSLRVNAQAGLQGTHGNPNSGNSLTVGALSEVGVGSIGGRVLPYAMAGVQGLAVYCPFMSKDAANEICGEAGLKGMAGPIQLEGAYNADIMWRHKVADGASTKAVHSISVVAGVDGDALVDLSGVQAASNIGAKLVIQ